MATQTIITQIIKTITDPVENNVTALGKVEKKSGKRIGYNYIILKSLKESRKNDVVKCFYIKSLLNFGFCVIKEGTYGESLDKHGRDIKSRLIWQGKLHAALQDKVRVPRLLGNFEENGNYYLVIELIKGKSLGRVMEKKRKYLREGLINGTKIGLKFIDYAIQLVDLLGLLHKQGIVHRDATAANFIVMPDGSLAIIDLELSYSLQEQYPFPPFTLGTQGYMSPEQEITSIPTIKEDIFPIGAILLNMWSGFNPIKLTSGTREDIIRRVNYFVSDTQFANLIINCLEEKPESRPEAEDIITCLQDYKSSILTQSQRQQTTSQDYSSDEIREIVQRGIHTLSSPIFNDKDKGWFSENLRHPQKERSEINKAWYSSFASGASGIIYFLGKAKQAGMDIIPAEHGIQNGIELIKQRYINNDNFLPGLHAGSDGIAVSLSVAMDNGLINKDYSNWIDSLLAKPCKKRGYIDGIAGQGIANLLCSDYLDPKILESRTGKYVDLLLENQDADGSWIYNSANGKNRTKPGFSQGISGITYFLFEYVKKYPEQTLAFQSAVRGIQWLQEKITNKKGKAEWLSFTGKRLPDNWKDGAPGTCLALIKGFEVLRDDDIRKQVTEILTSSGDFYMNSKLNHEEGWSGIGEIYLNCFRTFKDEMWLQKATDIAQLIINTRKFNKSYGHYWISGIERNPLPDFIRGNSGILHFLLRVNNYNSIGFPLLPFS